MLFNATDVDVNAGKKDKFLVEWIAMLDTDPQSDAKSLWSAIANDRAATQHKINAFIARRPDSDSNASVGRGANSSNGSTAKRRVPSKLASSLTVPDSADADVFGASPSAGAAADTVASVAPAVVAAASTPIVVTPAAVAPASSASSEPAMQFATPKSDDVELRARLSQVTQERDKLAAQLAAAQRALTAASSAAATAAAASATTSGAAKASSAPAVANAAVPAPDQGIAKHMYLIALLMVVFAFLFGRFSVATSKMLWSE